MSSARGADQPNGNCSPLLQLGRIVIQADVKDGPNRGALDAGTGEWLWKRTGTIGPAGPPRPSITGKEGSWL
ncbi:MAG: hypothetical protein R2751_16875 [Bacteroidales bacterium]